MLAARLAVAGVGLLVVCRVAVGQPLDPVARALTAQTALSRAKAHLTAARPAAAVDALEPALPFAGGDPVFLDTLKAAYTAELAGGDSGRAAALETRLKLLAGPATAAPTPAPEPAGPDARESLGRATALFRQGGADPGRLAAAAKLFAAAFQKVEMTPDQLAAYAFCRVRVAADALDRGADPAGVAREVTDAVGLAPAHPGLRERADAVVAAAKAKPATGGTNFVAPGGPRPDLVAAAEGHRSAIFARWGGAAGQAWTVPCELMVHPDGAAFAAATNQPAWATGHATVTLSAGKVTARRIDLRGDDPTAAVDALPRELTHVILADLFPAHAPPAWAALGMAVLATSPLEQSRYARTLDRCAAGAGLLPVADVLQAPAVPAGRVTEFHVESVGLAKYLTAWKGDKAFAEFVTASSRYGPAGALKRVYGADVARLEADWNRSLGR